MNNGSIKRVLIYRDYGVSIDLLIPLHKWLTGSLPQHSIEYTDATSIVCKDALAAKDVCAFVMPGGQARGYKEKLAIVGDRKIQNFVKGGGLYYGICGGAYYPCRKIDFTGRDLRIIDDNTNPVFFDGIAKGSVSELTDGNYYASAFFESTNVVSVEYSAGKDAAPYYRGGPVFIGDFSKAAYEILATYKQLPANENVAAVKCLVGKGAAILIAVHPEVDASYVNERIYKLMLHKAHAENIRTALKENGQKNRLFSNHLLKDLIRLG